MKIDPAAWVGQVMFTDYPFAELGDTPGEAVPFRMCLVKSYDGNKYCQIEMESGHILEVKAGYLKREPK